MVNDAASATASTDDAGDSSLERYDGDEDFGLPPMPPPKSESIREKEDEEGRVLLAESAHSPITNHEG